MLYISMPGGAEWIIILLVFAIPIYLMIELFSRKDIEMTTKLLWAVFMVLAPVLGFVCFLMFGRQQRTT